MYVYVQVCLCVCHAQDGGLGVRTAANPIQMGQIKNSFINTQPVLFVHLLFVRTQTNNKTHTQTKRTQLQWCAYVFISFFFQ